MSDSNKLEILFNLVLLASYKQRKKNKHFDGFNFWQPIKKELEKLDKYDDIIKFKKMPDSLVKTIMEIPEFYKNGYGKENIIESHHFLIQQVRIPTKEKASVKKITQIALNIGQWKGLPNEVIYKDIKYDKTNLDNIYTYITKTSSNKLSKYIDDDTISNIEKYLNSL